MEQTVELEILRYYVLLRKLSLATQKFYYIIGFFLE